MTRKFFSMIPYTITQKNFLLTLARDSILHGVRTGKPLPVNIPEVDEILREKRACFVTLHKAGALRGCIGMLAAVRPLAEDVAENAFAAAFRDPRFANVTADEVSALEIHISVLSPAEPINFTSEEDLLAQIRPGVDGLILSVGGQRGTFLPAVWEALPDKKDFLRELKGKAGLPADFWSSDVKVERYTCESIGLP